jgi:hypothetical protein
MNEEAPPQKKEYRIDMAIIESEIISEDDALLVMRVTMIPDPQIWKEEVVNGEQGYLNTIDNFFISDKDLAKFAPTLDGKPFSTQSGPVSITQDQRDAYLARSRERFIKRNNK